MLERAWWFESTRGHLEQKRHPGGCLIVLYWGRLAQLVRAAALHAVGLGFESLVAHFSLLPLFLLSFFGEMFMRFQQLFDISYQMIDVKRFVDYMNTLGH